jgi:hypothetical protein
VLATLHTCARISATKQSRRDSPCQCCIEVITAFRMQKQMVEPSLDYTIHNITITVQGQVIIA